MKRLLTVALMSLLAAALIAPAAEAASKTLHYQDRGIEPGGEVLLDILWKNKKAHGPYTPRRLTLYHFELVAISCQMGGDRVMAAFGPTTSVKLTRGSFFHDFQEEGFTGSLSGELRLAAVRGNRRVDGSFEVVDADFPPDAMNCSTNGLRRYSATPCRTGTGTKLPPCRVGGGS